MEPNTEKPEEEAEQKEIRHTISAEETFTLAKDVYDLRCLFKNIWANRAVIGRRINIASLAISIVFTAIYALYVIFSGVVNKLSLGWEIAVYAILVVFLGLVVAVLVLTIRGGRTTTKNLKRYGKTLKITRYAIKIASLVMAITSIVLTSLTEGVSPASIAVDTVFLIISVIIIIFQAIGLIAGGLGGLARWLLSPVKVKTKFSVVVLEWYRLLTSGESNSVIVKKIDRKYEEDIGRFIDNTLVPELGKRKITAVHSEDIFIVLQKVDEKDRPIAEGTLKNIFAYAEECGYIVFNPCRDMDLTGSIEIPEKKTIKKRFEGIGVRIAKSFVAKQLGGDNKQTPDKTEKDKKEKDKKAKKQQPQEEVPQLPAPQEDSKKLKKQKRKKWGKKEVLNESAMTTDDE